MRKPFIPYNDIVYYPVNKIASIFGRPSDECQLFVSILIAFLLSFPLPLLRNVALRKLYSTGFGLVMTFYTFGISTLLLIPYNMYGYVSMLLLPRKYAVVAILIVSGGILTVGNYYEMLCEDLGYNVSLLMMITFCK